MSYDRITRKDVERAFALVFGDLAASDAGKLAGFNNNAHNIGKYALDHNSAYGGWVVIVYAGGDSGAGWCHGSTSWGDQRRSGRAMFDWLNALRFGRELQAATS